VEHKPDDAPTLPRAPWDKPETPPSSETRRDWEVLQEDSGQSKTERLRIAGGWLYRTTTPAGVAMVHVTAPEPDNSR
jgi:hypothetical protein